MAHLTLANCFDMTIKSLISLWRNDARRCGSIRARAEVFERCANDLEKANEKPSELLCPTPDVEGCIPIVLYFKTNADADEFCELVKEAKPNLRPKRLE